MLVPVHEIRSDGVISVTLTTDLVSQTTKGEFTYEQVSPGQYVFYSDIVMVGLVGGAGDLDLSAGPFHLIGYEDAANLPVENFVFADTEGKKGSGFLYADDQVVIFTVEAGQALQIEKPLLAE
jgi:hypothetical protein